MKKEGLISCFHKEYGEGCAKHLSMKQGIGTCKNAELKGGDMR
jgi:hypothetical protein